MTDDSAADAPLQSTLWYRVAALRPKLQNRAKLHRHRYRGELWYLLQDPATGQVHRFTPAARLVLAAMDGQRNVHELWQLAQRHLGAEAPTQDDIIQLLGQLHGSDLLAVDGDVDVLEVFERGERSSAAKRRRSWANPMALRIPLWDPGQFLNRHVAWWRLLWSRAGALLWLVVVLPALVLLPAHWADLTGNLSDRMLQVDNLLLLGLVFPLIKALHELGHASATRAAGGEVHDMGVMLLVLMPVPYVDASAATVLRSRWQRALIGAAGMLVEVFIAALAFYLWLAVEPGLARALCFNVMVAASVSALIFNGNPLLRYDAYYILTDLVEMPNLAQRSASYWGYLLQRYLLRLKDARSQAHSAADRWWFACYGLASTIYRLFVTFAIALFIGSQFFFFGVLLALWAVAMMVGTPIVRAFKSLQARQSVREQRARVLTIIATTALVLVASATWLPLPYRALAEGVVWLPEQASVRTGTSGFVQRLEAVPGSAVVAGQPLVRSVDPMLDAQRRLLEARVAELEARYSSEFVADRASAEIVRDQLTVERAALARTLERHAELLIRAATDGVFSVSAPTDLPGRWHRQGDVLGFVLGSDQPVVRVVVEQAAADLVAVETRKVELRMPGNIGRVLGGRIIRQVPSGTDEVPSRALVASGGGRVAGDPRDPEGRKTLERVFEIDVALNDPLAHAALYGQRVFVNFQLAPQPLATQVWRAARRLFLRHFDV